MSNDDDDDGPLGFGLLPDLLGGGDPFEEDRLQDTSMEGLKNIRRKLQQDLRKVRDFEKEAEVADKTLKEMSRLLKGITNAGRSQFRAGDFEPARRLAQAVDKARDDTVAGANTSPFGPRAFPTGHVINQVSKAKFQLRDALTLVREEIQRRRAEDS